jgi:hypothetical protein
MYALLSTFFVTIERLYTAEFVLAASNFVGWFDGI